MKREYTEDCYAMTKLNTEKMKREYTEGHGGLLRNDIDY